MVKLKFDFVYIFLMGILYFSFSLPYLDLPGVHSEETYLVMNSAYLIKYDRPWGMNTVFFNKEVALMMNEHTGIISTYVYYPAFLLFGINVYSMRLTRIVIGFITLVLTYYFAKEYFNRKTGVISTLLISTLPFYIFYFRQGYLCNGLLLSLMLISLISFLRFYKSKKPVWLYVGAMSSGLGLSNKINFLWFIVGYGICLIIFRNKFDFSFIKKKQLFIAGIVFLVFSSPLIIYNALPEFWNKPYNNTLQELYERRIYPEYTGNNLEVFSNLVNRLYQLDTILNNSFNPIIKINNFLFFDLFFITLFLYFLLFWKHDTNVLFFSLLSILMFLFTLFTITTYRPNHLLLHLPLFITLFSYFLLSLSKKTNILEKELIFWEVLSDPGKLNHIKNILLVIVLSSVVLLNILSLVDTYSVLNKHGKVPGNLYESWYHTSDSVYSLSDYLVKENTTQVIAIGGGLGTNIEFLTNFEVNAQMCEEEKYFEGCINLSENNSYLLILTQHHIPKWYFLFKDLLIQKNMTVSIEKIFYMRDGTPEILLFKVVNGTYDNSLDNSFSNIVIVPKLERYNLEKLSRII